MPIELHRVGRRELTTEERTPFGLHDRSNMLGYDQSQPPLFSMPLADLKQFLAPTAKDYFLSLAD